MNAFVRGLLTLYHINVIQLFIWHYNRVGDPSSPTIVLKTRRSLRAVHFHPHAAPFLLTAEVELYVVSKLPFSFLSS